MSSRVPQQIKLKTKSSCMEISYEDMDPVQLSFEFLRVHSPSAEVKGHGKPILQHSKSHVKIQQIEPTGNYAIKIVFSDGHDTGLYSWDLLYDLCVNQDKYWQDYLEKLESAGLSRHL